MYAKADTSKVWQDLSGDGIYPGARWLDMKTAIAAADNDDARRSLLTQFINTLVRRKGRCNKMAKIAGPCHLPKGHEHYDMTCCSGRYDIGDICRSMTLLLQKMREEEK